MSIYLLRYDLQLPTNNMLRVMNYLHTLVCNRPEEGSYLMSRNMHVCNARSNKLGHPKFLFISAVRLCLKRDGARAETRFRLSAKRTSPFKSVGGRQFSRLLAAELCLSAVAMLDTPRCEVVWRVLASHSIRQFPLHFPSRASTCAIAFQLESTTICNQTSLRPSGLLVRRIRNPKDHLARLCASNNSGK